jgi:hypothetical protein
VRNPHLFCFVEECRWPCARGRSGLIITGHRSISVFKVDTAVLVNLRSNPIYFFFCFRPIHKRARICDRIYADTYLKKYFPIEIHETTAFGRYQQTHHFVRYFRVNLKQKNLKHSITACSVESVLKLLLLLLLLFNIHSKSAYNYSARLHFRAKSVDIH